MSKRYPGNFITGNPVALSQTSNNGIWDVKDNYQATTTGTWQEADGIHEIAKSLRFRKAGSSYLSRTPSVAGNQKTFTISTWLKISKNPFSSTDPFYIMAAGSTTPWTAIAVGYDDSVGYPTTIQFSNFAGSSAGVYANVTFRDPSAWYHIIIAIDTTQTQQNNRIRFYVNGVEATKVSGTYPSQNATTYINSTSAHWLCTDGRGSSYLDGYMTETHLVDGQQLDPSYFGYFDPVTNIWQPKKYTGAYGVNGFYLPFTESDSVKNLGRNFAGNTNFCPYSESVGSWGNTNCTISSNSTTAPNGTTTADTITANSTASAYMRQDTGINMGISTYYTMSVYLKAGTATTATFSDGYGTGAWVTADLSNGVITGAYNPFGYQEHTITAVGNGWYRVTNSFITHSSGDYNIGLRVEPGRSYGGTGASGASVYVWGAQINLGKTADAYFPNDVSTRSDSNWTLNNMFTYDSMVDSPTNIMTSATDIGGVISGNYCTLNTIDTETDHTVVDGGLKLYKASSNWSSIRSTHAFSSGKWYFETTYNATWDYAHVGVLGTEVDTYAGQSNNTGYVGNYARGWAYQQDARIWNNNTTQGGSPVRCSSGDTCMCAVDMDSGKIWFGRNGTWFNSGNPATGTNAAMSGITGEVSPAFSVYGNSSGITVNFGQRPFLYTPPAGFKSVNSTNLQALGTSVVSKAALQANKWFDTTLYAGTGSAQSIKNSGFKPDFVWLKSRNSTAYHSLWNSAAPGLALASNDTMSEQASASPSTDFISFDDSGFTVGANSNWASTNGANLNIVAWQWKQSPTSGFNIVTYTGDGSLTRSITHNLGATPKMIFYKRREGTAQDWGVYHTSMGLKLMQLNTNSALWNGASNYWYSAPTSSVFYPDTTNGDHYQNTNGVKYIAYIWAEVPGFSKFGSYTGSGQAAGTFIHTGFRPAYVLIKRTDAIRSWYIKDNRRPGDNRPLENSGQAGNDGRNANLAAQSTAAEELSFHGCDFLSNGFRISTSETATNEYGGTYIYAAFAESPFALNNRARQ